MEISESQVRPPRRRIYLVRHGDVTYFDDAGKPFRPDTVPLNPEGRAQASALGREMSAVQIDRVVCSDLPRCRETAELILAGRPLNIEVTEALREVRPGRLADVPSESVVTAFLGAFSGFDRATQFLGGETFGSLADRVLPFFAGLLAETNWRSLLVVAHGGVNRILLAQAIGEDLQAFAAFEQDPCCVNILDIAEDGRSTIRLVNATPYDWVKKDLHLTTMERLYEQYRARSGNPAQ